MAPFQQSTIVTSVFYIYIGGISFLEKKRNLEVASWEKGAAFWCLLMSGEWICQQEMRQLFTIPVNNPTSMEGNESVDVGY
jgi:hypothetical protein